MLLKDYIGKTYNHPTMVKVYVNGVVTGSRTMLEVTITDRGKGWDWRTQSYKGWKNRVGWMRGENRQYGFKDTCHKNELINIK